MVLHAQKWSFTLVHGHSRPVHASFTPMVLHPTPLISCGFLMFLVFSTHPRYRNIFLCIRRVGSSVSFDRGPLRPTHCELGLKVGKVERSSRQHMRTPTPALPRKEGENFPAPSHTPESPSVLTALHDASGTVPAGRTYMRQLKRYLNNIYKVYKKNSPAFRGCMSSIGLLRGEYNMDFITSTLPFSALHWEDTHLGVNGLGGDREISKGLN